MARYRTAASAWKHLCDKGGLDPNERDLPLLQTLKDRLNPNVSSLQQALEGTTIEAFLNAFFGVVSPFIGMMSDLLGYFEAANATEGPEEWVLVLGEGGEELTTDRKSTRLNS